MRVLYVKETNFEIEDDVAEKLLEFGAVYECGEEHDLHLTPDHIFTLEEVELLMQA